MVPPQNQLFSDRIGGATIDRAEIKSLRLAKGVGELKAENDLGKGDDVEIRIVARVVEGGGKDKYDAHGNISETTKRLALRVDELDIVSINQGAFVADMPSDDPAPDDDDDGPESAAGDDGAAAAADREPVTA